MSSESASDPGALLDGYHATVAALFDEFRAAETAPRRRGIAEKIAQLVAAQCAAEEEILYPEVARAGRQPDDVVRAAQFEGAFVRKVVEQLRAQFQDDRRLAATVDILRDYLEDYVNQQRSDVLPRLRREGSAAARLCQAMLARRSELLTVAPGALP